MSISNAASKAMKDKIFALGVLLSGCLFLVLLGSFVSDHYGGADGVPTWVRIAGTCILVLVIGTTYPKFLDAFERKSED